MSDDRKDDISKYLNLGLPDSITSLSSSLARQGESWERLTGPSYLADISMHSSLKDVLGSAESIYSWEPLASKYGTSLDSLLSTHDVTRYLSQGVDVHSGLWDIDPLSDSTKRLLEGASPSFDLAYAASSKLTEWAEINPTSAAHLFTEYAPLKDIAIRTAEIDSFLESFRSATSALSKHSLGLIDQLDGLSLASTGVFEDPLALTPSSPSWLIEAPVIQPYEAARNVSQLVALEEDQEIEIEPAHAPGVHGRPAVFDQLAALRPEFGEILLAAREAIANQSRDYVRHASVSLRELLDKVLDELAPRKAVTQWSRSSRLLKEGQSNKARLVYVFRNVETAAYASFAEKDIDHIAQTFIALNEGTHRLEGPFGRQTMETLLARVEGHLLLLLTVAGPASDRDA